MFFLLILCPQSLLVLVLRPPGGSGDENGGYTLVPGSYFRAQ